MNPIAPNAAIVLRRAIVGAGFGAAHFYVVMLTFRALSTGAQGFDDMNSGRNLWLSLLTGAMMGGAIEALSCTRVGRLGALSVVAAVFSGIGCSLAAAQSYVMQIQYGWPTYLGIGLVVCIYLAIYAVTWRFVEGLAPWSRSRYTAS